MLLRRAIDKAAKAQMKAVRENMVDIVFDECGR
jgi:hypothetical protein